MQTKFLSRLLQLFRRPRQTPQFIGTAQAKMPLAFKSGVSVTMASPMGTYAGIPSDMRKLAEQQFQRIESSHGATIN